MLMSCLVDAPLRPTLVPLAAGLAVGDTVARAGAEPELKWPNDVLISGRKCAGVLVEAPGARVPLVVGIGVNTDWRGEGRASVPLSQEGGRGSGRELPSITEENAPEPGGTRPWTSLAEELGRDVDRWDVLVDLLDALEGRLAQGPDGLLADYRTICSTLGREVIVEVAGRMIAGVAVDVDERGALSIWTEQGAAVVDAGDVTHPRAMH